LSTIKRRMRDSHLFGRRAAAKFFLTEDAKAKRLRFANKFVNVDWSPIVFTDEVKIETSAHGMTWVRRPPGTRHHNRYIKEVNRSGRCTIMVWGAMTSEGLLPLVPIEGTLNRWNYVQDILKTTILPYKQEHDDMVLMHDGAAAHRANYVKEWLKRQNIRVLPWPSTSPDLNIIENFWNLLKEEIGPLNHVGPNQKEKLWEIITAAWDRLGERMDVIKNLYESMNKRMEMVIERGGAQTKY